MAINSQVDQAIQFVLNATSTTVQSLTTPENRQALVGITRLITEAESVAFFGLGSSGIIAEYGARLFSRSGMPSYALNATGIALAEQLLALRERHLLIMMLNGRPHREAMATITAAESLRIPIAMFLGKLDTPLRQHAAEALILPRAKSDHVQIHAPALIAVELLHITFSSMKPKTALDSLERLIELRTLIRPNNK
ncbi:MurR/RpiR family transcriptional regulator [Rhizobium sp.]|uniref:MurR/RpiR family transcriptional regulator n=1 Tax=Rhizobium sp. TaxID=391 RepID=UPI0028A09B53